MFSFMLTSPLSLYFLPYPTYLISPSCLCFMFLPLFVLLYSFITSAFVVCFISFIVFFISLYYDFYSYTASIVISFPPLSCFFIFSYPCNTLLPSASALVSFVHSPFQSILPCYMQDMLAACFILVSCLAYSSTLKMETTCSSETSVDFHRTTLRYIPKHRTL
jgi:hypothetical protein